MRDRSSLPPVQERPNPRSRVLLQVLGVVQGVGFRPFVHRLATHHALDGTVYNDNAGVYIDVEGSADELACFQSNLVSQAPPLARIEQVVARPLPAIGMNGFTIAASRISGAQQTLVSPDMAICDDCLAELFDPDNRRYRYPFINCTNCGPRYTIIQTLPYDRPQTTMADFTLCSDCAREYNDPDNRRFHAQPNACPKCGPQLEFRWLCNHVPGLLARRLQANTQPSYRESALEQAQSLLAHGRILGVKGIGGFHLACDATSNEAVNQLRQRKQRGDKPLAIMARDLASVLRVARAGTEEIALLTSCERPIVLLEKRAGSPLSDRIAPGNAYVGVMLPYSPLHHLLFAPSIRNDGLEPPPWLVMTSANYAGEPLVADNQRAVEELGELCDALLLHDREIYMPCDDSVQRVFSGLPIMLRRARGYAPLPIALPIDVPLTLAVGGEIKNAACLANGRHAFMSQHIGDLVNLETQESFMRSVKHLQQLFDLDPVLVACDQHPAYHSTKLAYGIAETCGGTRLVQVQHHHAHLAALMAEHGLDGSEPIIGFCFDGTGYGTDGAIWGGEVLVASYQDFQRVAHLAYFPLPGGDAAIHRPYRAALAALWSAGIAWEATYAPVAAASATELAVLRRQLETGLNCVPTSSMGRLFDIVASLAGIRQIATYEAQAAIELESSICRGQGSYSFTLTDGDTMSFDAAPVLASVLDDVRRGIPSGVIAGRFHNAVADLILAISLTTRDQTGLNRVGLSGGVFQNAALLQRTLTRLESASFTTLIHQALPTNDGGLALGQAMVAAYREREQCV